MLLIGFGHRARQGKTFSAQVISGLASELAMEARPVPHSAPRCGVRTGARIYSVGDEVQRWCEQRGMIPHRKPREALTAHELSLLGHYGWKLREDDEDVWINQVFARIAADRPDVALIPNIRYPNEARRVNELDGWNVLVERFNLDGSRFIAPDRDPNAPSETSLDFWNWDYRISAASGQLDWLTAQAGALFSILLRGHSGEGIRD